MSHLLWQVSESAGKSPAEQILYNRGVTTKEAEAFLKADSRLLYDFSLLPGVHKAISRVYRALLRGEKIAIYGDFDTDGITAAAILAKGLKLLGSDVLSYIPHRLEGHGLNLKALESLFHLGVSLVMTADCGTSSYKEVLEAKKLGLDIIITDHHSPQKELPSAIAVVNPQLPPYLFPHLAGAGVAYKLVQALLEGMGIPSGEVEKLLELVALGTVTDVVPLVGENRYLVKEGLKGLNSSPHPGIRELISIAGLGQRQIDTWEIAWVLGPRLNAAGRMEHAYLSYRLLLTDLSQEAKELAEELEKRNAQRKGLLDRLLPLAMEMALSQQEERLLFISGEEFVPGIAGLVASRLVDEFYRPAAVVGIQGDMIRGSLRSIPQFDLMAALTECSPMLLSFGGHAAAAGFSAPLKDLERIKHRLQQRAAELLTPLELRPQVKIDAIISLSGIDKELLSFCHQLAPYGVGNLPPTFLSQKVKLLDARLLGEGKHLRLKFRDERGVVWDGVGFNIGDHYHLLSPYLDIVYQLKTADHITPSLELNILDLKSS